MVWIPRFEELPFSIMVSEKKNYQQLLSESMDMVSTALYLTLKKAIMWYIRGPYGNSFTLKDNSKTIILIGAAPGWFHLLNY